MIGGAIDDIAMYPGGVDAQPIAKLDQFISKARDKGYEFTQNYSPDAGLIARGRIVQPLDHLTTTSGFGSSTKNPLFVEDHAN
jgi:hypothetical protein